MVQWSVHPPHMRTWRRILVCVPFGSLLCLSVVSTKCSHLRDWKTCVRFAVGSAMHILFASLLASQVCLYHSVVFAMSSEFMITSS